MTTLGRTRSALLVIDVQNEVVANAYQRDEVVANIGRALERARANTTPVIWVQHSDEYLPIDSPGWRIVPELEPTKGEPVVRKLYRSSFEDTDLEELLAKADVGHLFICGAETNNCVRHTSHAALERGYDVTLLHDAHTTTGYEWNNTMLEASQIIDEQNSSFWQYQLPGRSASIAAAADAAL